MKKGILPIFFGLFLFLSGASLVHAIQSSGVEGAGSAFSEPGHSGMIEEEKLWEISPGGLEGIGGQPQVSDKGVSLERSVFGEAVKGDVDEDSEKVKKGFYLLLILFIFLTGSAFLSVVFYFILSLLKKFNVRYFKNRDIIDEGETINEDDKVFQKKEFTAIQQLLFIYLSLIFFYLIWFGLLPAASFATLGAWGSEGVHLMISMFIIISGIALFLVSINLFYLFFKRSRRFPENCKFFLIAFIIFQAAPATFMHFSISQFFLFWLFPVIFIGLPIMWLFYLRNSEEVKKVFVNK